MVINSLTALENNSWMIDVLEIILLIRTGIGAVVQAREIHFFAENGFNDAWISSSVHPLVSGTNFGTNKTVKPHMLENVKNVLEKR